MSVRVPLKRLVCVRGTTSTTALPFHCPLLGHARIVARIVGRREEIPPRRTESLPPFTRVNFLLYPRPRGTLFCEGRKSPKVLSSSLVCCLPKSSPQGAVSPGIFLVHSFLQGTISPSIFLVHDVTATDTPQRLHGRFPIAEPRRVGTRPGRNQVTVRKQYSGLWTGADSGVVATTGDTGTTLPPPVQKTILLLSRVSPSLFPSHQSPCRDAPRPEALPLPPVTVRERRARTSNVTVGTV